MKTDHIEIAIDDDSMAGSLCEPGMGIPGILFIHGWAGSQARDQKRSRVLARLGTVCLTFDMRGHGAGRTQLEKVTPAQNLSDVCAAYDMLAAHHSVDPASIAVVASSYGAYLSTHLLAERPVRWLSMRVPALYRDRDWNVPKHSLDRKDLHLYRSTQIASRENRALRQCRSYDGDVLIIESEHDDLVPHPTIASYLASFSKAKSITHRIISGADHALSDPDCRRQYDELLIRWIREMIFGARS